MMETPRNGINTRLSHRKPSGSILGLLGGVAVCLIILFTDFGLDPKVYLISHLPVKMQVFEFAMVGLVATFISFVATLYPSYRASQLPPVDGLRYD